MTIRMTSKVRKSVGKASSGARHAQSPEPPAKKRNPPTTETQLREYEGVVTKALAVMGDPACLQELEGWLALNSSRAETAFWILLGRAVGSSEREKLIARGLADTHNAGVRVAAMQAVMADQTEQQHHPLIVSQLSCQSDYAQRAARDVLLGVTFDDPAVGEVLVGILRAKCPPPKKPEDARATVQDAVEIPSPTDRLVEVIDRRPDDRKVRDWSYKRRAKVYAMQVLHRPTRIEGLDDVLLDLVFGDDPDIGYPAAYALSFTRTPEGVAQQIIARLPALEDSDVLARGLTALGYLRVGLAFETFRKYLAQSELSVKKAAASGLGRLPDGAGRPLLEEEKRILGDPVGRAKELRDGEVAARRERERREREDAVGRRRGAARSS